MDGFLSAASTQDNMEYKVTCSLPTTPTTRRVLGDLTNLSEQSTQSRGRKRPGAGRPSSADRNERFVNAVKNSNHIQELRQTLRLHHEILSNRRGVCLSKGERRIIV